jgi:dTDP-4-amino-4,6-dideoxygalactose transaminase
MGGLVPFNRPFVAGKELIYIRDALRKDQLAGDGFFTKKCQQWLEKN